MNKKLFGAILACVLILCQGMTVLANPSGSADMVKQTGSATTVTDVDDFEGLVSDAEALAILDLATAAGIPGADFVAAVNATGDVQIEDATFVVRFHDVTSTEKNSDGKYVLRVVVPALPAGASVENVRGLHYSVVRDKWEVLTPESVVDKEIVFLADDCSPLTVYVTGAKTSPKTGETGTWMMWLCAAAVLLGASAVYAKKSRR